MQNTGTAFVDSYAPTTFVIYRRTFYHSEKTKANKEYPITKMRNETQAAPNFAGQTTHRGAAWEDSGREVEAVFGTT